MKEAGLDVDKDMTTRYSGSHAATLKAVESGVVDAGTMDGTVYKQMTEKGDVDASKVRVFFTSRPFVDYVWVARKGLNPALAKRFKAAFMDLKRPQDAEVLDILRGEKFVEAKDKMYDIVRNIAKQLGLLEDKPGTK